MARILVVDDTPVNRELLQAYLEPAGHELVEAECGEDALRLAAEQRPDLVLLDVIMPGIDGFETARRLKAAHQALPIILLTSLGEPTAGAPTDADAYLAKPFDRRKLEACIAAVMGRTGR